MVAHDLRITNHFCFDTRPVGPASPRQPPLYIDAVVVDAPRSALFRGSVVVGRVGRSLLLDLGDGRAKRRARMARIDGTARMATAQPGADQARGDGGKGCDRGALERWTLYGVGRDLIVRLNERLCGVQ